MNPLLLVPMAACLLSACSLSGGDIQNTNIQNPTTHEVVESRNTTRTGAITDPVHVNNILKDAYSEELLAHDIYMQMRAKYPELSQVNNIIQSEAEHQSSVGQLLDSRNIARPTDYGNYSETYTLLSRMIESSLVDAIEVGIMVETGDIDHLVVEYRDVSDSDVRQVFERIGGASFNHLRAFLRIANQYSYIPKIDTSKYLSPDEVNTNGSLGYKMTELLRAKGLETSGNSGKIGMNRGQGHGGMKH